MADSIQTYWTFMAAIPWLVEHGMSFGWINQKYDELKKSAVMEAVRRG